MNMLGGHIPEKNPLIEHLSINLAMFEPSLGKLTYDQIVAGTNKFYEKNVIRGDDFGIAFKLLGYCPVGEKKLIVYEYMVKGSLNDWLRNQVADINASNILLNEDFEVKVSDFGLVRLISDCESHTSTDVAGTIGYILLACGKQPTGPEFKDKNGGNLVDWIVVGCIFDNPTTRPTMLRVQEFLEKYHTGENFGRY
ncbi:hypothetical protein WN943_022920 [Citrus x changshan-huyou]